MTGRPGRWTAVDPDASTCGDPNPGSAYNASCRKTPDHVDNHDNGFSQWASDGEAIAARGPGAEATE